MNERNDGTLPEEGKMARRIGLFGAGRIGTLFLRNLALSGRLGREFDIAAIADREGDAGNLAYRLTHDSVYGKFPIDAHAEGGRLILAGRSIPVIESPGEASRMSWKAFGAEWVLDASGVSGTASALSGHLSAGAERVIVSGPAKGVKSLVYGVNHFDFYPETDRLVSAASCTVNCLAPVCCTLIREGIGIRRALTSTVHSATSGQNPVDGHVRGGWRTGRAAGPNILPFATTSPEEVGDVLPTLAGKLRGIAFRVPVSDMAVLTFDFTPDRPRDIREVMESLDRASQTYMRGVLGLENDPQVSSMRIGDPRSAVVDIRATLEANSGGERSLLRLVLWYDNEWGYVSRLADLVFSMAALESASRRRHKDEQQKEQSGRVARRDRTHAGSGKIRVVPARRPDLVGRLRHG
jgi:glyceraldehyde 3-phosphate dehydrogenase